MPSPYREEHDQFRSTVRKFAEKELFGRVCERFGLPVWEIELSEDESGMHAVDVAHAAL